jgi:hypothetical protein
MKKLSFREYYESKKKLLSAGDTIPRIRTEYVLTKYCKVPVYDSLDTDVKTYISFKPKDAIGVLWERSSETDEFPAAKHIVLLAEDDREVFPCWNNKKLHRWLDGNTHELQRAD